MWQGTVAFLHFATEAGAPMIDVEQLTLVAGKGIEGDRYMLGNGFYSRRPEQGRQATLFELETLVALQRDLHIELRPEEHRRNITTRGVPLNHLVGRRFRVGEVLLEATRLSVPCKHVEQTSGKAVFNALVNRAGLNTRILQGGVIRAGDVIRPE